MPDSLMYCRVSHKLLKENTIKTSCVCPVPHDDAKSLEVRNVF